MPVHDWTRVSAGTFHAFHVAWLAELQKALNHGLLPSGYYALAEQVAGGIGLDVLTLESRGTAEAREIHINPIRRRRLVIRHSSGDRVVAFLEIVSPGNKDGARLLSSFLDKAVAALVGGYHLLVIDLFPPGPHDPNGIHGAIWDSIDGPGYTAPPEAPLTLAAYAGSPAFRCYVEPTSVGTPLIEMPLFLSTDHYVNVPLEATYLEAWSGVPERWRRVIEDR
ncbi:MAG: hypothetical protein IT428_28150 [Planctomycetaceae bacterium]|nr:hypothetical protein [Planctomycetaceae bacterium]